MRIFKKILLFVGALIILLIISLFAYKQYLKPNYTGTVKITDLNNKVEVFYDHIGVPHIYAENQHDAYVTLGYVHAKERLWQMELIRRIAAGRLSELFGKNKVKDDGLMLQTDKFFLGLGIEDAAKKTIKNLDTTKQSYKLTKAYLNGINQYINNGKTPIEYQLIGVKKENFELKDIYNVFGYMSFSFAMAHKTDPLLTSIKNQLDASYLTELGLDFNTTKTKIPNYNLAAGITNELVASVTKIMAKLPIPAFIGSNAWVVGPEKTTTGKVIFANDPHIGYAQPSVWFQSHIVCPDFEIYGFNLALTPFPLLGHNYNFAYGLTMFENDDVDFYMEKVNPNNDNQYFYKGEYVNFKSEEKTIKIKGQTAEKFKIKSTAHGPIMNSVISQIDQEKPIAMSWIYTKFKNNMLQATYEISHSNNLADFKAGVSKIIAPGLNVMYGDANDNIAWFAAGKLYKHDNGVDPNFILNGANGEDDAVTYLDFSKNPQALNPSWNYVYSANNQPDQIEGAYYAGYYLPEDRAKRIVDVLSKDKMVSVTDMKNLIIDVKSATIPSLLPIIVKNIDVKNLTENETIAFKILKNWDASFESNQIAPVIFTKFKYQFLKHIFEDELGTEKFNQLLDTHLIKQQFQNFLLKDDAVWFDDITTNLITETKKDLINLSFKESISTLEKQLGTFIGKWKWKDVHQVTFNHPIGKKLDFLGLNFSVGPFAINGSSGVLNNQFYNLNNSGIYTVNGGPSTRRIIDFSNIENSFAILPTGQSGNIFSQHYKDQTSHFIKGKFYKMYLNKTEIQKFENKVVFTSN